MPILNDELSISPRFDWDRAKYFYYIAKLGSQTEAAHFLNTSQSALSRQMTALEQELKCKLISDFRSSKRSIQLTRKGEEFFKIIEKTFLDLKGFNYSQKVMSRNGKKRRIRISTTHAIAAYMLNRHIGIYNEQNPDIIFEMDANDQFIDLTINDVDIAIRPYDPKAKGIIQDHFFTLEKKLFASPHYLEKFGEPQTVEELKNHAIIAHAHPEKHPYSDISWILRLGMPAGQTHEPVYSSNSLECLVEMARKGLGIIGGYPEMSVIRESGLKNILPQVTDQPVKWYFIFPEYLQEDPDILEFKEFIFKAFQ